MRVSLLRWKNLLSSVCGAASKAVSSHSDMGGKRFLLGRARKHTSSTKKKERPGRPAKKGKQAKATTEMSNSSHSSTSLADESSIGITELHQSLTHLNPVWIDQTPQPVSKIHMCIVSSQSSTSKQPLRVTHSLTVNEDLTWELFVLGHKINTAATCLHHIPSHLSVDSFLQLVRLIEAANICPGNPDERFVELVTSKKGSKITSGDDCKAFVDDGYDVNFKGRVYPATVRTTSCTILTHRAKCLSCNQYRPVLRSLHSRWSRKRKSPAKQGNNRYLSTPQKEDKLRMLQVRVQAAEGEVRRLKKKIDESKLKHGVQVSPELHQDLSSIMESHNEEVLSEFPEGSFRRLFWEEQLKVNRLKDTRQMRWHPMMVRWCLNLKLLSSSSYHALRTSGFLKLPSERTLRDYTHYFKAKPGFQQEVDEMLVDDMKLSELPDWKKHVVLLLDEMKVKESLVYDKHGADVIGFVELGAVNDQLDHFERDSSGIVKPIEVANHILAIMVRGIFIRLRFPYAHFPTRGVHADHLFLVVWEAVERLERLGLKVLVITADGASPNRKFFRLHKESDQTLCYKTANPYTDEKRALYFMSDVPHLIKTTRNCWSHSFAHACSRKLWNNGNFISWQHLSSLYDTKTALGERSQGLSLLKKLSQEHVHLTSYSRMRVGLAAQVLSETVANGLKLYVCQNNTKETEKFVRTFDKFFECLNGRNLKEHILRRKPNLKPYFSSNDGRLEWLLQDFLTYLDAWEASVKSSGVPEAEMATMCLSSETLEGLRITVHSFVEVTKYLLTLPGVTGQYILSECFSQDPLENYFGQLRARGGRCENPTVKASLESAQSLRIQRSLALQPVRGNSRSKRRLFPDAEEIIDSQPLPKRKKVTH